MSYLDTQGYICKVSLLARCVGYPMHITAKNTSRPFNHGVSQIDDCTTGLWTDPFPVVIVLRIGVWSEELQTSGYVEQNC